MAFRPPLGGNGSSLSGRGSPRNLKESSPRTFKEGSPFGSSIGSRGNRGGSPADGMGGGGIQLTIQHLAGMELLTVLYMSMYLIIIIIKIMLYYCSDRLFYLRQVLYCCHNPWLCINSNYIFNLDFVVII